MTQLPPSAGPARTIAIVDYQPRWPDEFRAAATRLRQVLGPEALRIDHIGSTSVPGLAAKDIVDIQITVEDLTRMQSFEERMAAHGFQQRGEIQHDNFCSEPPLDPLELRKKYFREPIGARRTHLHVRERGRFNQRYALLFRDYLRANAAARSGYALVKRRLAAIFPHDIDGYLSIKDPFMDVIYVGAEHWALPSGWNPDSSHL